MMDNLKKLEARVKALEAKVFPAGPIRESAEKKLDAIERQVRGK